METTLYGIKVQIPDNFLTEVSIYESFSRYAKDAKKAYHSYYYKASGTREVISGSRDVVYEQYRIIAKNMISLLAANDIFGYSESDILRLHGTFAVEQALKNMSASADSIDRQRDKEEAYRDYRKKARGRFVGGGFGLEGAIKGMAMAGAANLATGLLHSVANAFGNVGSAIKRSLSMDSLYHSGVCGDVIKAIDSDAMKFYDVLEGIFDENNIRTGDIPNRIKEADTIYRQIDEGLIPDSSLPQAVAKMISVFPGKLDYYIAACNLVGSSNGELKRLVERFGLDSEYFSLVEASAEWRKLIFGDMVKYIAPERETGRFYYLDNLLYSRWNRGIIPQLEYGPEGAIRAIVFGAVDQFNEQSNSDELGLETFEDGKNCHLLAVLEARNIKLGMDEVPILSFLQGQGILDSAMNSEFVLLTTKNLYSVSKAKIHAQIPVEQITSLRFFDTSLEVNGGENFSKMPRFYNSNDRIDFEYLLNSIIVVIQCLVSIGHKNRNAALLNPSAVGIDNEKINDISSFFRANIMDLLKKYGTFQCVMAPMITKKGNRSGGAKERYIIELKQEIAESDDPRYIRQLEGYIAGAEVDLKIEQQAIKEGGLIKENEVVIARNYSGDSAYILTDRSLYVTVRKKKDITNYETPLHDLQTFYYEWKWGEEGFVLNGNKIVGATINSEKDAAKEFVGVVYSFVRYLKEYELLKNEKPISSETAYNGKIVTPLESEKESVKECESSPEAVNGNAEPEKTSEMEELYYTVCFSFSEYMQGLPIWFDALKEFNEVAPKVAAFQRNFISVLNVSDQDWDRMCNLQNDCSGMTENEVMMCAFDLSSSCDGSEGILITNKYVHWVYKSQAYQMKLQMAGFSNSGKASLTEIIQGAGLFAVPWLFDMGNEERQSLNQMLYAVLKIANECKLEG